jgi:hypothetical protein
VLPLLLFACGTPETRGPAPAVSPEPPVLRRLTYAQYVRTVGDLFGDGLVLPTELEPDSRSSGLYAVGVSLTSISALGVERYESAAYDIAEQVFADDARRAAVVACATEDEACARETIEALGRRAWRRPLSEEEADRLTGIAVAAAQTYDDFDAGLTYAVAALLQSPYFLFRPEVGEDAGDGTRRYTGWEMASRLSYFLWDTMPDDELLDAAEAGELVTEDGVAAQVDRMLADDRARDGVRAFLTDMLELDALDDLTKDPTVYVYASAELGPSAREQTLLDAEAIVFDADADFRTFLTTPDTHLDRTLAAVYDVPAPAREGFAATTLKPELWRRGFLGQVSFLALQSHATSTSVTKRGLFVREVLLCQSLPDPPAGLNTSIPETSEATPTMRDRVEQHLADPTCATCHNVMDPIGLGFENFDGIGRWRDTENGAPIDASGDLDGTPFYNAADLAVAIHNDPQFAACLNETVLQYAWGREATDAEAAMVTWHADGFSEGGYRLLGLLRDVATGPAFRTVGEIR